MNYPIVIKVLGFLLLTEAITMVPSALISLYYGENDLSAFLITIAINFVIGWIMYKIPTPKKSIKARESMCIVSIGWILFSFFGTLPLFLSGSVPSFINGFFEMVSGFTTTGATNIQNIEALPKGILFWRSFSHWIGGMGILVFTIALLPALGVGGFQIFKAESPGPTADRIVPRMKDTAKILYTIYIGLTFIEIILLVLGGMSLYDATLHTFGTVGTGGFSTRNSSVGAYNSTYINIVISIFMILSGVNFSLYYQLIHRRWKDFFKDDELKLYLGVVGVSTVLIAFNLGDFYDNIGNALEHALFQVSSIITTTGYATADFDAWPTFSKVVLFTLMFIGGSAGSTAGGIKNIRIVVLLKLIKREMSMIFHPRAVIPIKLNDKAVSSDIIARIMSFIALYFLIFVISTVIISLEGVDLVTASSAVATCLGNVGPGLALVGPTRTFFEFSGFSKLLLSFLMLLGRLEIFTLLMLFIPKFWKDEI